MGYYIWYSEEGIGWSCSPLKLILAVPNVTAHPSMASVLIAVLLYNSPLLCGFNVGIKGLMHCIPQTQEYVELKTSELTSAFKQTLSLFCMSFLLQSYVVVFFAVCV